jgi:hypothetical protein
MYRPNFCAECGKKVIRLHWHLWTSSKFCDDCARKLRKDRLRLPAIAGLVLLSVGYVLGRAARPSPPPLVIQRREAASTGRPSSGNADAAGAAKPLVAVDEVYICGARTKKGTPCSRRVHAPERCWQHKGMSSMIRVVPIK